jgi:hypothetical protein
VEQQQLPNNQKKEKKGEDQMHELPLVVSAFV